MKYIFTSFSAMFSLFLLAACQHSAPQPVDIMAEDMCSHCKMAISEKRYAAELIDQEMQVLKFDDIACMMNYLKAKQNKDQVAVYFVVDFDSQRWVKAYEAYFVRSSEYKTPMGGGTVAFADRLKAEEATSKYQGRLLSFNELII